MGTLHSHDFLIGIDSDGCAFDNMTVKHRQCFAPAFIEVYGLSAMEELATKLWDFVNLFGRTRGCNRFRGVINTLDWLKKCGKTVPGCETLRDWADRTASLSASALAEENHLHPSPEFDQALLWSEKVNAMIKKLPGIPPVSGVSEALGEAGKSADLAVISQAPGATITGEWTRYGLASFISVICGQEAGSKAAQMVKAAGGRYGDGKRLLIGDAPGDLAAAKQCGALFYPIVPGREAESWRQFRVEALQRFLSGTFAGNYQQELISGFEAALPETPDFI